MAAAAILKNRNIATSRPRFDRFGPNLAQQRSSTLLSRPTVKNLKFQQSKMAAAAVLQNRKIAISRPRLDEFWPNLARWRLTQFDPLDHSVSKIGPVVALLDWFMRTMSRVHFQNNIRCTKRQDSLLKSGSKTANIYVKKTAVYAHC